MQFATIACGLPRTFQSHLLKLGYFNFFFLFEVYLLVMVTYLVGNMNTFIIQICITNMKYRCGLPVLSIIIITYQEGIYCIVTQPFSIFPPPINSVNHYIKVLSQLLKCIACLLLYTKTYLSILKPHKNMHETKYFSFVLVTSTINLLAPQLFFS